MRGQEPALAGGGHEPAIARIVDVLGAEEHRTCIVLHPDRIGAPDQHREVLGEPRGGEGERALLGVGGCDGELHGIP
ncbi:hypothetical protein B857_03972 [Solibacillus isronensis B3W22]|uniref:Uncharacterized protein n=1 Tax=Solibacillus isronensis B3W22 TaxID=1224748 RepID=K1KGR8_9BACL|nr:hypothetical protein B857_03972 [Solibacillus isronensis B3W22]